MELRKIKEFSASGQSSGYDETSYVSLSPQGNFLVHSHMRAEDAKKSAVSGYVHHPQLITHVYAYPSLKKLYTSPPTAVDHLFHPFHFFLEEELVVFANSPEHREEQVFSPTEFQLFSLESGRLQHRILPPHSGPLEDGVQTDKKDQLFFWQKSRGRTDGKIDENTDENTDGKIDGNAYHRYIYHRKKKKQVPLESPRSTQWVPVDFSFSADGKYLMALGFSYPVFDTVFVWEAQSGKLLYEKEFPYMGGLRGIRLGSTHPDNTLFIKAHTKGLYLNTLQFDFIRLKKEDESFHLKKHRLFVKAMHGFHLLADSTYYLMKQDERPWALYHSETHELLVELKVEGKILQAGSTQENTLLTLFVETEDHQRQLVLYSMVTGELLAAAPFSGKEQGSGLRDQLTVHEKEKSILLDFQGRQYLYTFD